MTRCSIGRRNSLELDPDEATEELRRRATIEVLGKIVDYLDRLADAEAHGDVEEIVRMLNFADPTRGLARDLVDHLRDQLHTQGE